MKREEGQHRNKAKEGGYKVREKGRAQERGAGGASVGSKKMWGTHLKGKVRGRMNYHWGIINCKIYSNQEMGVCFCFHLIYGKSQIWGARPCITFAIWIYLLCLAFQEAIKARREVQQLSSFPDILKAVKRMSLAVCLLKTHIHSAAETSLCRAFPTAWKVNTTDDIFPQSALTCRDSVLLTLQVFISTWHSAESGVASDFFPALISSCQFWLLG